MSTNGRRLGFAWRIASWESWPWICVCTRYVQRVWVAMKVTGAYVVHATEGTDINLLVGGVLFTTLFIPCWEVFVIMQEVLIVIARIQESSANTSIGSMQPPHTYFHIPSHPSSTSPFTPSYHHSLPLAFVISTQLPPSVAPTPALHMGAMTCLFVQGLWNSAPAASREG